MKEWWDEDFRLFVEAKYKEGDFAKMCVESKLLFRKGMGQLMHLSGHNKIPLMIVSGGISEIIECHLGLLLDSKFNKKAEDCFNHQLKIISNSFQYKNGTVCDFNRPTVFTMNKAEVIYDGN